jgi:hypothetical protein
MAKITQPFVQACLEMSDNEHAKITEFEKDLFGLSSIRLRCFINNICSKDNTNYLEIGTYKGATLVSSIFGNEKTKAVGVEHFLYDEREPKRWAPEGFIWDNMKSQLETNISRYVDNDDGLVHGKITMVHQDFTEVDWSKQPKFDVCFFDVTPVNAALYDAFLTKVLPSMLPESVLIFSNFSNVEHSEDLDKALLRHEDKLSIEWKEQRISSALSDSTAYYSGIAVFGIKKKAVKVTPKPTPTPTANTQVKNG